MRDTGEEEKKESEKNRGQKNEEKRVKDPSYTLQIKTWIILMQCPYTSPLPVSCDYTQSKAIKLCAPSVKRQY